MSTLKKKAMPRKPKGATISTYKLALTLLFGQHSWIERDGTKTRIPVPRLATHFRTRPPRIREQLYILENWGVLTSVQWNQYYVTIQVTVPVNMGFLMSEPESVPEVDFTLYPDTHEYPEETDDE